MCGKCKVYMSKQSDLDCNGCKISMFCSRKDNKEGQLCETSLKAVLLAFVIPLCCIVLLLALAQGRVGEGWTALGVLLFLELYYLVIKIAKPDFSNKR